MKLLIGSILFPLSWIAAALGAVFIRAQIEGYFPTLPDDPLIVFWVTLFFGIAGGYLALRYTELSKELIRAIRIRITRARGKRVLEELRASRSELFEELSDLSRDLELPGSVSESGKVTGV